MLMYVLKDKDLTLHNIPTHENNLVTISSFSGTINLRDTNGIFVPVKRQ